MNEICNLEIRNLTYGQICELIRILDSNDSWKILMNEIRRDCFDFQDEERKYNLNEIK